MGEKSDSALDLQAKKKKHHAFKPRKKVGEKEDEDIQKLQEKYDAVSVLQHSYKNLYLNLNLYQ